MKQFLLACLLLFTFASHGQDRSLRIEGKLWVCGENEYRSRWRSLSICHNGECQPVKYHHSQFYMDNLEAGEYVFRFENFFQQTVTDTVQLTQNINDYRICLDDFQERDTYPLLEAFQKAEKVKIAMKSRGCFHYSKQEIRFKKRPDDAIVATLRRNKETKKVIIDTKEKLALVHDFFSKADLMNDVLGCTTEDDYTLYFDKREVTIRDGSCKWMGFFHLLPLFD